jgi:hypothetical protein
VLAAFGRPFPAVATWEAEPPAAPPPAEWRAPLRTCPGSVRFPRLPRGLLG